MTDKIEVYYLFGEELRTETVRDVLAFCRGQGQDRENDRDVEDPSTTLETPGKWTEFEYRDLPISLTVEQNAALNPDLSAIELIVDELYFRPRQDFTSEEEVLENSERLVELVTNLYEHLAGRQQTPLRVHGFTPGVSEVLASPNYDESISSAGLRENNVEYVGWLQILPPAVFSGTDEDVVSSIPAWRVEQLVDDAVLIVTDSSPTWIGDEYDPGETEEYLERHI